MGGLNSLRWCRLVHFKYEIPFVVQKRHRDRDGLNENYRLMSKREIFVEVNFSCVLVDHDGLDRTGMIPRR